MFQMILRGAIPPDTQEQQLPPMDPRFDHYLSVIDAVCDMLQDTGSVSFLTRGFGEDEWWTDVRTDLATILEQLPDLLTWLDIEGREGFDLDFYEQGMSRRLSMKREGIEIRIEGRSLAPHSEPWTPAIGHETLHVDTLRANIEELISTFLTLAGSICPDAATHPWLVAHFAR